MAFACCQSETAFWHGRKKRTERCRMLPSCSRSWIDLQEANESRIHSELSNHLCEIERARTAELRRPVMKGGHPIGARRGDDRTRRERSPRFNARFAARL